VIVLVHRLADVLHEATKNDFFFECLCLKINAQVLKQYIIDRLPFGLHHSFQLSDILYNGYIWLLFFNINCMSPVS